MTNPPSDSVQASDGNQRRHGAGTGESLAARRYALAAFQLAKEQREIDSWENALAQIAEFMSDPEVRRVLENTRVSQEPKQRLIEAALNDLPELPLNLARLLVRKHRTALAAEIEAQFGLFYEEERGIVRARATTAVALSDAERDALTRRLREQTGKEVILETQVDPALMGGLIVQIGDRLIDASTRSRLEAMRESLVGAVG